MEKESQLQASGKHFEAVLGPKFEDLSNGTINLRVRTAVWSEEFDNGHLTSRETGTSGASTKACTKSPLLTVGGQTATDTEGKAEFLLSDYFCQPPVEPGGSVRFLTFPIIFVATAQSQNPIFVTTRTTEIRVVGTGAVTDWKIEIHTWQPGGTPAQGQLVDWLCRFPFLTAPA